MAISDALEKIHSNQRAKARGFTLVELIVVIVIIGFIAVAGSTRFDSLLVWKQQEALRSFLNTWEFLYRESIARGEAYRLELNLDNNSYAVFREVPLAPSAVEKVDHLKNLRTRREKERRAEKERELLTLDEEFKEEDARESEGLERLFYDMVFFDPHGKLRLAAPLEFPNLAEEQALPDGVFLHDVVIGGDMVEKGPVSLRFSPRGGSQFAVLHLEMRGAPYTAVMNPATGALALRSGFLDFEFTANDGEERG